MLESPDSRASRREKLPHRVHEGMLGERLEKEGIGPRFSCPIARRQDAEDEHSDIACQRICFESTAQGEAVERWDENLRDHDVRDGLPSLFQRYVTVFREPNRVTGLIQEVRLELADVRIAIDDQDESLAFVVQLLLIGHTLFSL